MMLIDTLAGVVKATRAALVAACDKPVAVEQIRQMGAEPLELSLTATAHFLKAPLKRLVVGYDTPMGMADPRRRLDRLGAELESRLGDLAGNDARQDRFVVSSPSSAMIMPIQSRSFHLRFVVGDRSCDVLADLAGPETLEDEPLAGTDNFGERHASSGPGRTGEPLEAAARTRLLLAGLAAREEDVLIGLERATGWRGLEPAIVLRRPASSEGRLLTLSSPCLLDSSLASGQVRRVRLVFLASSRLLQGDTQELRATHLELPSGGHLPVLEIRAPERLSPGQRREAVRIQPQVIIPGTLWPLLKKSPEEEPPGRRGATCVVKDISESGARLALEDMAILSRFRWQTRALCTLKLPEPHGTAEVFVVVQRLLLYPDLKRRRSAHVGVRFLNLPDFPDRGLEKIRRYVREQRRAMRPQRVRLDADSV